MRIPVLFVLAEAFRALLGDLLREADYLAVDPAGRDFFLRPEALDLAALRSAGMGEQHDEL